jgi:hypothetical protein
MTYRPICIATSVLLLTSGGVQAASWQECNGTPVRPKSSARLGGQYLQFFGH